MNPIKQTVLHDPANGKYGNCFSAVMASLLHIPIETVPTFFDPTDTDNTQWMVRANVWLRQFGLAYILIGVGDTGNYLREIGIEGCHHEAGGSTDRFADVSHSCVGHDGLVVFDPHPSDSGLREVTSFGLLVALEPWRHLHNDSERS